ncbi:MAG: DUF1003 domain-containing protein [Phenylobacterium sp.]|uniref:DUF1003 domain-containing protein n=1 Tax=Phenylobacterium sp. TaxID=1871053 RepID=UPI0039192D55
MSETERRAELARTLLGPAYDDLTPIQRSVIDLIATEAPSGLDPLLRADDRSFWERLADKVAAVGGSWTFIFGFAAAMALWTGWNVLASRAGMAFDPYPFIFLNLVLSTLAAVQAPVILMSQNRAAARDRAAAEHDYRVNLRAELEIMHLHDKLDALRQEDMARLIARQGEMLDALRTEIAALRRG